VAMPRTVLRSSDKTAGNAAAIALILGMTLTALAGCSGDGAPGGGTDPNLSLLAKLYIDHMNAHEGSPPKDEAAFKDYIRQNGAQRLKGIDMNGLDDLFVSSRDHQPLVFVYGINTDPRRQSAVIGYEQSSVDGKRTVGYRYGTAELVDDARFSELAPGAAAAKR
jgi:hypothetical protein